MDSVAWLHGGKPIRLLVQKIQRICFLVHSLEQIFNGFVVLSLIRPSITTLDLRSQHSIRFRKPMSETCYNTSPSKMSCLLEIWKNEMKEVQSFEGKMILISSAGKEKTFFCQKINSTSQNVTVLVNKRVEELDGK
jgi:hypothetical protein